MVHSQDSLRIPIATRFFRIGDIVRLQIDAHDRDGDPLTHNWTQKSGQSFSPHAVSIHDANTASPWFEIGPEHANQYLSFTATVSDGKSSVSRNSFSIEVLNSASTLQEVSVRAQSDGQYNVGDTVTLFANAIDIDGDDLTFSWEQTAGPAVTLSDIRISAFTPPMLIICVQTIYRSPAGSNEQRYRSISTSWGARESRRVRQGWTIAV